MTEIIVRLMLPFAALVVVYLVARKLARDKYDD